MSVGVDGQLDRRVPHHGLNDLDVFIGQDHPSAAGVPQAVKIHRLAFCVDCREEIIVATPLGLAGVVGGLNPAAADSGQIGAEQISDGVLILKNEDRCRLRFAPDQFTQSAGSSASMYCLAGFAILGACGIA